MWTDADLLALKSELTNDPNTLGLTTDANDDVSNAEKLNQVRSEQEVDRLAIPIPEIVKSINLTEFEALSASKRQWLALVTACDSIDPREGGEVRNGLLACFAAQSVTRGNLVDLLTEPANRIEQLYRAGTLSHGGTVTSSDIARARQAV